jgi:hypothetical protein
LSASYLTLPSILISKPPAPFLDTHIQPEHLHAHIPSFLDDDHTYISEHNCAITEVDNLSPAPFNEKRKSGIRHCHHFSESNLNMFGACLVPSGYVILGWTWVVN